MIMVKFFVCGDVKPPKRAAGLDAGIDVFVPNLTEKFMMDLTAKNPGHPFRWGVIGTPVDDAKEVDQNDTLFLYLAPHEDLLIPTYLKALMPKDVYLKVANKSGVSTKQKFITGADTIDYSYEGVMHVHVINASNSMRFIHFGQSIAQLIPVKIDTDEIEVWYDEKNDSFKEFKNRTTDEAFYEGHESARGEKGFGSGHDYDEHEKKQ